MTTDEISDLPLADSGELLIELETFSVRQNETYRWLQERKSIQSIMDRRSPSRLVLPIHHAMFCAIAAVKNPTNILNLGCGPGALERKLANDFRHLNCVSLDASMHIIELAEKYFFLPCDHNFINARAEEYLQNTMLNFDVVMVDLFAKESMAQCLYELGFYENIACCLSAQGIASLNLIPQDQDDLLKVLLPLREYFRNVWMLEIAGRSNIVLLASKNASFDLLESVKKHAAHRNEYGFEPADLAPHFIRLPDGPT